MSDESKNQEEGESNSKSKKDVQSSTSTSGGYEVSSGGTVSGVTPTPSQGNPPIQIPSGTNIEPAPIIVPPQSPPLPTPPATTPPTISGSGTTASGFGSFDLEKMKKKKNLNP